MQAGEFEAAVDRLIQGRQLLTQQRARVAQLEAKGNASRESKKLLMAMERAVGDFERHMKLLRREITEASTGQAQP